MIKLKSKKINNLLVCIVFIFSTNLFNSRDIIRKNFFPNDKDKIEFLYYEIFGKTSMENTITFVWEDTLHSKNEFAFLGVVDPHESDTKAYILGKLKIFLSRIQKQKLISSKYTNIDIWIDSFHKEKQGNMIRTELFFSFYATYDAFYKMDWETIDTDVLWNNYCKDL